jgi:hypothetical protein
MIEILIDYPILGYVIPIGLFMLIVVYLFYYVFIKK